MIIGFIGVFIMFVAILLVAMFIHSKTSKILGRMMDFACPKGMDLSLLRTLLPLFLGFFFLQFSGWEFFVGLALIGGPLLYNLAKFKGEFWKVYVLKLMAFPVSLTAFITSLFFSHQAGTSSTREYTKWSGQRVRETTHYMVDFPAHIDYGNWSLDFVYMLGASQCYENYDGTRCLVSHARKLLKSSEGYDYEITPLYNINDPLPRWIAWLY